MSSTTSAALFSASGSSSSGLTIDAVVKTAAFTCAAQTHYLVNSTGGAFSITMPAVPAAGNVIAITDVGGAAASNFVTFLTTTQKFQGQANDFAAALAH